jgi:hydrogenase small subunit
VIAIGSCASWGGMPSTIPLDSRADFQPDRVRAGVAEILGKPVVTIPGCPPNPYNFLATVVHFLTFGKLPELDKLGRPKFAYSRLIHENCERRAHFDAGRFAMEFGDERPPPGLLPLQARLQGPGDLRQLLDPGLRRCRREQLAGRLRPSLHRLYRAGRRLHQADPSVAKMLNVDAAAAISAHRRRAGQGRVLRFGRRAGAVAGAAAGAAAMLTRNLGLSHAAEEAERAKKPEGRRQKAGA